MYCTNCGSPLEEDAKFCSNCGRSVNELSEDQAVESAKTEKLDPTDEEKTQVIDAEIEDSDVLPDSAFEPQTEPMYQPYMSQGQQTVPPESTVAMPVTTLDAQSESSNANEQQPKKSKIPVIVITVLAVLAIIYAICWLIYVGLGISIVNQMATTADSAIDRFSSSLEKQLEKTGPYSTFSEGTTQAPSTESQSESLQGLEADVAKGEAEAFRAFSDQTVYMLVVDGSRWKIQIGISKNGKSASIDNVIAAEGNVIDEDWFSGSAGAVYDVSYASNTLTLTCVDKPDITTPIASGTYYAAMGEALRHVEPGEAPITSTALDDEYLIPGINTRYLTTDEVAGFSNWELYLARNEIFARHGRMFNNDDLVQYFSSKSWYYPRYTPEEFDALPNQLNDYEKKNADLILQLEQQRNSPYL